LKVPYPLPGERGNHHGSIPISVTSASISAVGRTVRKRVWPQPRSKAGRKRRQVLSPNRGGCLHPWPLQCRAMGTGNRRRAPGKWRQTREKEGCGSRSGSIWETRPAFVQVTDRCGVTASVESAARPDQRHADGLFTPASPIVLRHIQEDCASAPSTFGTHDCESHTTTTLIAVSRPSLARAATSASHSGNTLRSSSRTSCATSALHRK
jgi:hypothetical protein